MAGKKFRMTDQRRIILEELEKKHEHPNASDVYERVKKRLPHISLGTVYRNLEILSSEGMVKRIDVPSGQRRFDAGTHEHNHIRCISCGKVDDVPISSDIRLKPVIAQASSTSGYQQTGCTIDFFGICPDCAGKKY